VAFIAKTSHEVFAYFGVILLLYHINILNRNTLSLAKRIETKKAIKLQRAAGTFNYRNSNPETEYIIQHFRSRSYDR